MALVAACPSLRTLECEADGSASDPFVSEHIANCPACRELYEELRSNLALLSDLAIFHAQPPPDASASEKIAIDGYEIHESVARGAQGVVYRATQRATKRVVAIKVLLGGKFATRRQRSRFEREVELAAALRHPNIVTFFDSGTTVDGRRFCVMEFVSGLPLDEYLDHEIAGGAIPPRRTMQLFSKLCSAVAYAHQRGVIHRDLKPANILIDTAGEPRIVDFGLARAVDPVLLSQDPTMTRPGEFAGTFAYASPEQTLGKPEEIDIRTDVYSLGVILFEMLTGRLPYPTSGSIVSVIRAICEHPPDPPSTIVSGIDHETETIVLKSLAKAPERRYQSVSALGRDIERYLAGDPIDAKRDSTWYLFQKTIQRHRFPVAAMVVGVVMLAVFAMSMFVAYRRASSAERFAATRSTDLADALTRSNIERGRAVGLAGNSALAEEILWREFFNRAAAQSVDKIVADGNLDPTRWALRELYLRNPCVAAVSLPMESADQSCLTLSRDGSTVIFSPLGSSELQVWDVVKRSPRFTMRREGLRVLRACQFNPDGTRFIAASEDGSMHLFDVTNGAFLTSSPPAVEAARIFAFDARSETLAVADDSGVVTLRNARTLEILRTINDTPARQRSLVFSPDGKSLVVGSDDPSLKVWRVADGVCIATPIAATDVDLLKWAIVASAFTPDGKYLAVNSGPNVAGLWEMPALTKRIPLPSADDSVVLAISPDGQWIATAGNDRVVRLWNPKSGQARSFAGHTGGVRTLAFSKDGAQLISSGKDRVVRTWDVRRQPAIRLLGAHDANILSVSFSRDGTLMATGSADGNVKLIATADGTVRASMYVGAVVHSVSLSCEGVLAAGDREGTIHLWTLDDPRGHGTITITSTKKIDAHVSAVNSLTFSPDGDRLATSGQDRALRMWNVATGEAAAMQFDPPNETLSSLTFSRDGTRLAGGGKTSHGVRLWDARSGKSLPPLRGHGDVVRRVCFSADGNTLASGGDDQTVRLWDLSTGNATNVLDGHQFGVFGLCFDPAGQLLFSTDGGGEIRIWDFANRRALASFSRGIGAIFGAHVSPDGSTLSTWGAEHAVTCWNLAASNEYLDGNLDYWRDRLKNKSN